MEKDRKDLVEDLKSSAGRIGRLYPVLEDFHGNIIDGSHRLEADDEWPRMRLESVKTERDLIIARVISNACRRSVSAQEKKQMLDRLGGILLEEGIEPGEIAKKISEETGMSYPWVMKYLPKKWKNELQSNRASSAIHRIATKALPSILSKSPKRKLIKVRRYANTDHAIYLVKGILHENVERAAEILNVPPDILVQNAVENAIRKRTEYEDYVGIVRELMEVVERGRLDQFGTELSLPVRESVVELLQWAPWDGLAAAFHMIDDIYFVGTKGSSCHLVVSDEGHALIDTGKIDTGHYVLKGILDLGFDPKDVKYILLTHAHNDHAGSVKLLAEKTGARVCLGESDIEAVVKGNTTRPNMLGAPPFKIDVPLGKESTIALGNKEIQAVPTPGHTPGCFSFGFKTEHEGHQYNAFLFGGPGLSFRRDEERKIYHGAREDYEKTLDLIETFQVDIWLGAHPNQNRTFEKLEQLRRGVKPNPYIDPEGWRSFIRRLKRKYRTLVELGK